MNKFINKIILCFINELFLKTKKKSFLIDIKFNILNIIID